jgi:hypothetical protein
MYTLPFRETLPAGGACGSVFLRVAPAHEFLQPLDGQRRISLRKRSGSNGATIREQRNVVVAQGSIRFRRKPQVSRPGAPQTMQTTQLRPCHPSRNCL